MYYVYSLIDPRTAVVFYIGKGKGDRAYTHCRPSNLTRSTLKNNKIKSIQAEGLQPAINILHEDLTEADAFILEQKYIASYGRIDVGTGTLCNHSNGGEGQGGRIPWNKGKVIPDHIRQNMSTARKESSAARECYMKNIEIMKHINTGRKRPIHSERMYANNPNRATDMPVVWVNMKTNLTINGTRHDVLLLDPTANMSELGQVISGKYKSHRGWTICQNPM